MKTTAVKKRRPSKKDVKACILYFKQLGLYAYQDLNSENVLVSFNEVDIAVEITDDEVWFRAELYKENFAPARKGA